MATSFHFHFLICSHFSLLVVAKGLPDAECNSHLLFQMGVGMWMCYGLVIGLKADMFYSSFWKNFFERCMWFFSLILSLEAWYRPFWTRSMRPPQKSVRATAGKNPRAAFCYVAFMTNALWSE